MRSFPCVKHIIISSSVHLFSIRQRMRTHKSLNLSRATHVSRNSFQLQAFFHLYEQEHNYPEWYPNNNNLTISPVFRCEKWKLKYKYIPCVPHKNNCKNKFGSHDMKQTDSSIIIVRNVCLPQHPWLFIFSSRRHDRQSSDQTFLHEAMIGNHRNKTTESLHNAMARTINMHTDLQISSSWEHISTWNMHE